MGLYANEFRPERLSEPFRRQPRMKSQAPSSREASNFRGDRLFWSNRNAWSNCSRAGWSQIDLPAFIRADKIPVTYILLLQQHPADRDWLGSTSAYVSA